jgi:HSP20 family protein
MQLIPTRRWAREHPLQRQISRLFEDFFGDDGSRDQWGRGSWAPAVDVYETDDEYVVTAEVPGIDPKDLDISVTGDMLTIKGEKSSEKKEEGERYHLLERSHGSFSRTISLPSTADAGKVEASGKDGVLTLRIAKREETKPRRIEVN